MVLRPIGVKFKAIPKCPTMSVRSDRIKTAIKNMQFPIAATIACSYSLLFQFKFCFVSEEGGFIRKDTEGTFSSRSFCTKLHLG